MLSPLTLFTISFTTSSRTTDRYACCVTSSGGGYTPTNNGGNNGGSNSNPNTGPTLIYIVWSIGLLMIGYSIWYFKKGIKE